MSQKGFASLILMVLIAIFAFIILKNIPALPQLTASPKSPVTAEISAKVDQTEKKATDSSQLQPAKLEKYLVAEAALLGVSDNISLYFKDLRNSQEISIDPTRSWIPASTIKSYVVLEAFRQKNLGLIDFNQTVVVKADNIVPTELETDEFPRLREGTKATIQQLIEAMVIQSDNTAYNTLLDILDRRNINLALKNIGITETVVGEKLNLDDGQFQQDLKVAGRQPNTTTVKDLASFFDLLYNKKIASADEILAIFKRQKINNMIPALLPQNTLVAHKTGDWAPIYHDGGVIFKPNNPFILTVFTNTDNPKIISQLARVAYFQNAQSVGKLVSFDNIFIPNHRPNIALVRPLESSDVLAAETPQKFPEVSASDLGIRQKDLNINSKQTQDFLGAIITPGSIFYDLKKFFEEIQLNRAQDNASKIKVFLNLSKNRLSETKSLIGAGNFESADNVLKESEKDLEQATELAKKDPDKELFFVQIKQVNDLHFAIFAERAQHVNDDQKEQFIDNIYNFYQKNHQKVTPTINSSVIANPTQQKPAVGTIAEVKGDQAKIQFDDGSSKQIILTPDTKVRNFQEESYQSVSNIRTGDKIAVVGLSNSQSQIIPQFILKNIPRELPQRHQGTIIEIKPDENTIKILDQKGEEEIIRVNLNTVIKSKDTNVSLEGIKAGSQVTVFGILENTNPASSGNPSPSLSPSSSIAPRLPVTTTTQQAVPSAIPSLPKSGTNNSAPATTTRQTPSSPTTSMTVQATSITVTKNSSGKDEKVESKPQEQKQPPQNQPPKVESKKEEPKPTDKKK